MPRGTRDEAHPYKFAQEDARCRAVHLELFADVGELHVRAAVGLDGK